MSSRLMRPYYSPLLRTLSAFFIDPLTSTREDVRRVRMLAGLILLILPVLLLIVVMPAFTDASYSVRDDIGFWPSLVGLFLLGLAYVLARYGYYLPATGLLVGTITIAIYVLATIDTSGGYAWVLNFLFVPLLLLSYLLPAAWSLAYVMLNLILLPLLPLLAEHITLAYILNSPFSVLLLISVLVVPMTYLRETWVREREDELRESEARFRQMVAFYPDMVAVHSEGVYVYINEAGLRMLGATDPSQVLDQPVTDFVHPDYRDDISARMVRGHGSDGVTFRTVERMMRLDGSLLDAQVTSIPTRYQGRIATQVFVRPVVEAVAASDAGRDERYARIFDSNVIGIALGNVDEGRFFDVNQYFAESLGYTREELIGKSAVDLGWWPDVEEREEMLAILKKEGTYHNDRFLLLTRTGETRVARISLELIEMAEVPCVLSLAQDVTAQYEAEQALQTSEQRYRALSQLMTDYAYYLCVNEEGAMRLEWVTGAFEAITGYWVDDESDWGEWRGIVHPQDMPRLEHHLRRLTRGESREIEYRIVTRSGDVRWLHQHDRPEWNGTEDGTRRVIGIYGAARDVTDRLSAEESLRQHALQQAVVAELGQRALEQMIDASTLQDEAVHLVAYVLSADVCALWLLDETAQALELRAIATTSSASAVAGTRVSLDRKNSRVVRSFYAHDPVLVTDAGADPTTEECPLGLHEVHSLTAIAIHGHDERPIGVLVANSTKPDYFTIEDANFLQSVANVLAAFIEQKRAEEAEREQRLLAEALRETASVLNSTLDLQIILDRILDYLALVVPYDSSSIMLIGDDGARIIRHRGFEDWGVETTTIDQVVIPHDNTLVDDMLANGGALVIPDVREITNWYTSPGIDHIRSYMGAPITAQGEVLGIINVDSATVNAFTQEHAQRLTAFVNQAGLAIKNARHAEDLQARVEERTAALNLEHNRLQTILDASGEGIFYAENQTIRYANQVLGRILACDPAGLSGEDVTRYIYSPEPPTKIKLQDAASLDDTNEDSEALDWSAIIERLADETIIRQDTRFCRADGSVFDAGLTISRVGPAGPVMQMVVIVRDVSQAKALEAQKSRFIANASHELRTPLASLKLRLYMLNRDPDRAETHLAHIEHVTERMSSLVEDLLDHGRFERGAITLHRVDLILQSVVADALELNELQADEKGLSLAADLDSSHPLRIFADFDRMLQVFTNLIGNAVHYTPSGGRVQVRVFTEGEWACVDVEDNGPGIPEKDRAQIFMPFVRRSKDMPGTGLGLSIAYEIVVAHGGQIDLVSEVGVGSTFTVRLPLSPIHTANGQKLP